MVGRDVVTARRPVPGTPGKCRRCNTAVVWVRTMASSSGAGGKLMPLDPLEDPKGNVATRPTTTGRAVARVLGKDDSLDRTVEVLAMPHVATCQPTIDGTQPTPALPDNVLDFRAARAKRGTR